MVRGDDSANGIWQRSKESKVVSRWSLFRICKREITLQEYKFGLHKRQNMRHGFLKASLFSFFEAFEDTADSLVSVAVRIQG